MYTNGLIFDSSNPNSSLTLSGDHFINLKSGFKLDFQFYIYNESSYGSILKICEKDKTLINFSYFPVTAKGGNLTLRLEETGELLTFYLDQSKISRNSWQQCQLKYTPKTKTLLVQINNISKTIQNVPLILKSKSFINFGCLNKKNPSTCRTAHYAIRNISIFSSKGQLKHYYPLTKSKEKKIVDFIGNKHESINNPIWIEDYHNQWTQKFEIHAKKLPAGIFSDKRTQIYIFTGEVLSVVNANTFKQKIIPVIKRLKTDSFNIFLNTHEDKLYCFNSDWSELILFNLKDFTQKYYSLNNTPPLSDETIAFYHPIRQTPIVFMGMSENSYTSSFFYLDVKQRIWKPISLKKTLPIEKPLAFHLNAKSRKLLILGTTKNDITPSEPDSCSLWEINLSSFSHNLLNKIPAELFSSNYKGLSKNIISPSNNGEYFLFQQDRDSTYLIKFNTTLSNVEHSHVDFPIENSIASHMAFNRNSQEFIFIANNHTESFNHTDVFTINYPPVEINDNTSSLSIDTKEQLYILLPVVLICCILFLLIIAYKRKKQLQKLLNTTQTSPNQQQNPNISQELMPDIPSPSQKRNSSSIELFGEFKLYNQQGKCINQSFTTFLEEFFLFLLVSTIFNKGKGITAEQINQAFWPYHDTKSARNNRGVNISRLRKILSDIEGMDLVFDKNQYNLAIADSIDIDLLTLLNLSKEAQQQKTLHPEILKKINKSLNKGVLLKHITAPWLDPYRDKFETTLSNLLEIIIASSDIIENQEEILSFCRLVLTHDKLNETAINLILFLLHHNNKKDRQRQEYQSFCRNYQESMGEDYSISIKDSIAMIENQLLQIN
ncbi:hypothetical protein DMA11_01780 [Marinilabiliaceae bacterium JC017]|nr:hypothetical protein DMA11_01780 [Marinilabiliaceae bacterium JC017]